MKLTAISLYTEKSYELTIILCYRIHTYRNKYHYHDIYMIFSIDTALHYYTNTKCKKKKKKKINPTIRKNIIKTVLIIAIF